jgi:hypothetical protein
MEPRALQRCESALPEQLAELDQLGVSRFGLLDRPPFLLSPVSGFLSVRFG